MDLTTQAPLVANHRPSPRLCPGQEVELESPTRLDWDRDPADQFSQLTYTIFASSWLVGVLVMLKG